LILNNEIGILEQRINDHHKRFTFDHQRRFANENELENIISETMVNPNLFDLSKGRVFHCEIIVKENDFNENEMIRESDVILIGFHHVAYDRSSLEIFLNDFSYFYNNPRTLIDEQLFEYIDYSIHERIMDMNLSKQFWISEMNQFNSKLSFPFPMDRHRSSIHQRSGLSQIFQINFDDQTTKSFIEYSYLNEITPFQLGLTIFYLFLFQLSNSQTDLCVTCLNANRFNIHLKDLIGMFVSTLPYRIQIDQNYSFKQFVNYIKHKSLAIIQHSNYPLQFIIQNSHLDSSNITFLETLFDFINIKSNNNQILLDQSNLEQISLKDSFQNTKFHFSMTFIYDQTNKLSSSFVCSRDLLEQTTLEQIAQTFKHLFDRIFQNKSNQIDNISSINKIYQILPKQNQTIKFHRMENIIDQGNNIY
jgi:hypothetical protein